MWTVSTYNGHIDHRFDKDFPNTKERAIIAHVPECYLWAFRFKEEAELFIEFLENVKLRMDLSSFNGIEDRAIEFNRRYTPMKYNVSIEADINREGLIKEDPNGKKVTHIKFMFLRQLVKGSSKLVCEYPVTYEYCLDEEGLLVSYRREGDFVYKRPTYYGDYVIGRVWINGVKSTNPKEDDSLKIAKEFFKLYEEVSSIIL